MANISKPQIRDIIFKKYDGHCAYCGCLIKRESFTIDHINAKYRGFPEWQIKHQNLIRGTDDIENYNPCCQSCNSSKSTLSIESWRKEITLKVGRLNRDVSGYRLLKRFGLIEEKQNPVKFYFENF